MSASPSEVCPYTGDPGCKGCADDQFYHVSDTRKSRARPHSPDNPLSPSHYVAPNGQELRFFVAHLPYYRGAAIKYVFRAGVKPGSNILQDLKKARECIDIEIERLEQERAK